MQDADAACLLTYADTIGAEVGAELPNAAVITGSGGRLKQFAGKVGNASLTACVTSLVNILARMFGGSLPTTIGVGVRKVQVAVAF